MTQPQADQQAEAVKVQRIDSLPENALDASAVFHSEWLPKARALMDGSATVLIIAAPAAPYDHDDWRRAASRDLARELAPKRVVMIAGQGEEAALTYISRAPGVTGQYLKLD